MTYFTLTQRNKKTNLFRVIVLEQNNRIKGWRNAAVETHKYFPDADTARAQLELKMYPKLDPDYIQIPEKKEVA